jgi:hypothetical protein
VKLETDIANARNALDQIQNKILDRERLLKDEINDIVYQQNQRQFDQDSV